MVGNGFLNVKSHSKVDAQELILDALISCEMRFSIERWMLLYEIPPCDFNYVYYWEFVRGLALVSILVIVDSLTFTKMTCYNRTECHLSVAAQQWRRREVEKRFVRQVW
ncbi:hypothetical protein GCK32_019379, partial [Trichostrongylus colubriformis]